MTGWQPISSAPLEQRSLACDERGVTGIAWRDRQAPGAVNVLGGRWTPTRWHPLPPPPWTTGA